MTPTIKAAREHYETLPPSVKARLTAKYLLAVIQEAERLSEWLEWSSKRVSESDARMLAEHHQFIDKFLVDSQPTKK